MSEVKKPLRENTGKCLSHLGCKEWFLKNRGLTAEETINDFDYIKIKNTLYQKIL